jgi:wyosine [tRNA(Phe)-imidazoG37] synthetase (radical SAM superfamily)
MKYVFGPVPSRRLNKSLGIDTIPLKTCNWNCVYCQLGRTRPLVDGRKDYFPPEEILAEIRQILTFHDPSEIDWITFVGSGEPTLHASIGWLIRQVKALTQLPVAVITNGSLFYRPEVRQELAAADAVLPTLDAGSAKVYRRINRPRPEITFRRLLDGLTAFRQEYRGRLWPEVMLVQGLNDTEEALRDIAAALHAIHPDAVHINLPVRPPAENWVQPPDEEGLMRATAVLGEIAQVIRPVEGNFSLSGHETLAESIINIISRHPMRQEEIERILARWSPKEVDRELDELATSGRVQVVQRYGTRFLTAASQRYSD